MSASLCVFKFSSWVFPLHDYFSHTFSLFSVSMYLFVTFCLCLSLSLFLILVYVTSCLLPRMYIFLFCRCGCFDISSPFLPLFLPYFFVFFQVFDCLELIQLLQGLYSLTQVEDFFGGGGGVQDFKGVGKNFDWNIIDGWKSYVWVCAIDRPLGGPRHCVTSRGQEALTGDTHSPRFPPPLPSRHRPLNSSASNISTAAVAATKRPHINPPRN